MKTIDSELLSEHFSVAEATKTCNRYFMPSCKAAAKALAVNILEPLRLKLGRPVIINSWFRNKQYNAAVGGMPGSQHTKGEAADIRLNAGAWKEQLCEMVVIIKRLPFDQMIVESNGNGAHWLHVSYSSHHKQRGQYFQIKTK